MTETKADHSATLIQSANKDAAEFPEQQVKKTNVGAVATATQTKNQPASDLGGEKELTAVIPDAPEIGPTEEVHGMKQGPIATRRVAILVLGMHRSGTSALTRVISLLGADLPSNLLPARADNETGFWESVDVYRLDNEILANAGSSWDDWRNFNPNWLAAVEKDSYRVRAMEMLENNFAKSRLFVLKDSRICRFLPFWLEVLRELHVEPMCVLPIRNPLEVSDSLKKRNNFSPPKSYVLWLRHVLDAEYSSRGLQRSFLTYEGLLNDWRGAVAKLSAELNIAWPRSLSTCEGMIDGFLSQLLRHHAKSNDSVFHHPELVDWIKETYAALHTFVAHPESKEAQIRLDIVRTEFNRASNVLGAVLRSEEIARRELSDRACDLEHKAAIREAQINDLELKAATHEAKINDLQSRLRIEQHQNRQSLKLKGTLLRRLDTIQTSASWQLASPLRVAESRCPRLMRGMAGIAKLAWWTVTLRLPQRLRLRRRANELIKSGVFNRPWYITHNPDIVLNGFNPVLHWLVAGWKQRRNPNPRFDACLYLAQNPDLTADELLSIFDYSKDGLSEGNDSTCKTPLLAAFEEREQSPRVCLPERSVSIIIPVYNAPRELQQCLTSISKHTDNYITTILINDGSTDSAVATILDNYHDVPGFLILHNENNLGFTKTVNRGITLAADNDIIILNSDTEVTPGWVRRLSVAAYSSDRVATATPVSNSAGAFSVPSIGANPLPYWMDIDSYARSIAQSATLSLPDTPTANGFCMYIRRDFIDEIGLLDCQLFPIGYGEENDLCMRGIRRGWRHVVADSVFVYHVNAASFGSGKTRLVSEARHTLDMHYPEYTRLVKKFINSECMDIVRSNSLKVWDSIELPPYRVLYVISTHTGGTPQTNEDLMSGIVSYFSPFLLVSNRKNLSIYRVSDDHHVLLDSIALDIPVDAVTHCSESYDCVVASWLVKYAIELVHIRHIAWHSLNLPAISKRLGIPVVFSFHDFYTLCPTVNLVDGGGTYCRGTCTKGDVECRNALWPNDTTPPLKHNWIRDWRERMKESLAKCDAFVTTLESAKHLVESHFSFLKQKRFFLVPHGRDFDQFLALAKSPHPDRPLRIVFPGNISTNKGAELIKMLGEVGRGIVECHILGTAPSELTEHVFVHGAYKRSEFANHVKQIAPHIGAVLSIWPETWCHTLTELWSVGLPVAGIDVGAVGERIRKSGGGWLIGLDDARDPERLLGWFSSIRHELSNTNKKVERVLRWQRVEGVKATISRMSAGYEGIYRSLLEPESSPPTGVDNRHVYSAKKRSEGLVVGLTVPYEHGSLQSSAHIRLLAPLSHDTVRDTINIRFIDPRSIMASKKKISELDALIVQRTAISDPHEAIHLCKELELIGVPLVVDIDDGVHAIARSHPEYKYYKPRILALNIVLKAAAEVWTSTKTLAASRNLRTYCCHVLENCLDRRIWNGRCAKSRAEYPVAMFRFLYMGTRTHDDDLEIIISALDLVHEQQPNTFELVLVGATRRSIDRPWLRVLKVPKTNTRYPLFAFWLTQQGPFDLGLAPLVTNSFNRMKSDIKALDYAAIELATLASDLEPYHGDMQEKGLIQVVAGGHREWAKALRKCISDRERLRSMGQAAHEYLWAHREAGVVAARIQERLFSLTSYGHLEKHRFSARSISNF